jgi:hypothetical protein
MSTRRPARRVADLPLPSKIVLKSHLQDFDCSITVMASIVEDIGYELLAKRLLNIQERVESAIREHASEFAE